MGRAGSQVPSAPAHYGGEACSCDGRHWQGAAWTFQSASPVIRPPYLFLQYNGMIPAEDALLADPNDERRWTYTVRSRRRRKPAAVAAKTVTVCRNARVPAYTPCPCHPFPAELLRCQPGRPARPGRRRGYTLVGCDEVGVNAFFVRDDILACQGALVRAARLENRDAQIDMVCLGLIRPLNTTPDPGALHAGGAVRTNAEQDAAQGRRG